MIKNECWVPLVQGFDGEPYFLLDGMRFTQEAADQAAREAMRARSGAWRQHNRLLGVARCSLVQIEGIKFEAGGSK